MKKLYFFFFIIIPFAPVVASARTALSQDNLKQAVADDPTADTLLVRNNLPQQNSPTPSLEIFVTDSYEWKESMQKYRLTLSRLSVKRSDEEAVENIEIQNNSSEVSTSQQDSASPSRYLSVSAKTARFFVDQRQSSFPSTLSADNKSLSIALSEESKAEFLQKLLPHLGLEWDKNTEQNFSASHYECRTQDSKHLLCSIAYRLTLATPAKQDMAAKVSP